MAEGATLLGQRQTAKVLEDGQVHDVVELTFTVDGQGPFTVDVRVDQYEPELIRARVDDVVRRVRGAARLFSEG